MWRKSFFVKCYLWFIWWSVWWNDDKNDWRIKRRDWEMVKCIIYCGNVFVEFIEKEVVLKGWV